MMTIFFQQPHLLFPPTILKHKNKTDLAEGRSISYEQLKRLSPYVTQQLNS